MGRDDGMMRHDICGTTRDEAKKTNADLLHCG